VYVEDGKTHAQQCGTSLCLTELSGTQNLLGVVKASAELVRRWTQDHFCYRQLQRVQKSGHCQTRTIA
jgi:hypothetical protein